MTTQGQVKHSKSKDLSQADEEEHHHSRKGGRRKGDLDSPAGDPSAAVGETVQEKTSPQETKVRRWNYIHEEQFVNKTITLYDTLANLQQMICN